MTTLPWRPLTKWSVTMHSSQHFHHNKANDFHPKEFPEVTTEVAQLKEQLGHFQQPDDDLVIISYVKDHCVRSDLAKSHAELIRVLRSKGSCVHLENIFLISNGNTKFRTSLESYLKGEMTISTKFNIPNPITDMIQKSRYENPIEKSS